MYGHPLTLRLFPHVNFSSFLISWVLFGHLQLSKLVSLPNTPPNFRSVMVSNYSSRIYCISTSETTKEPLIFQAKDTQKSTKSIYAQFRSERKEILFGVESSLVTVPFEAEGWEYKYKGLVGCLLMGVSIIILTEDTSCCLLHLLEEWATTVKIWPFHFSLFLLSTVS